MRAARRGTPYFMDIHALFISPKIYGSSIQVTFGRALATLAHSIKSSLNKGKICLAPDKFFVDPTKLITPCPTHINLLWSDVNTFIGNTWLHII